MSKTIDREVRLSYPLGWGDARAMYLAAELNFKHYKDSWQSLTDKLEAPARAPLRNCCNCGAPGEPTRCSYCLTPS